MHMSPRHKQDQRDQIVNETRQALLDAAIEEFAREGFVGANINTISKAAGFAKGTIYNYFPSKRDLLLSIIDAVAAQHFEFIAAQVEAVDDPSERLTVFFRAGFAFVVEQHAPASVMITTLYGPDRAFKEYMFHAYQPLFELVGRDIVGAGIAQGVFRAVDPRATAGLLMNIYLGTASQTDESGRPWIDPGQVADFARRALQAAGREEGA
jgi:AcrR family transcriptional regulator